MMSPRRPPRVCEASTQRLLAEALPLLTPAAAEMARATQIFVVRQATGRGGHRNGVPRVTIPAWVFKDQVNFCRKGLIPGGPAFAAYYLAHELAHVKASVRGHGPAFMAAFKTLCPPDLQHYECIYKPRNAARAGIAA